MSARGSRRERWAFCALALALSVVPVTVSAITVAGGVDAFADVAVGEQELDHRLRYFAGVYPVVTLMLWRVVADVEKRGELFAFATLAVFLGGVARLVSVLDVGAASPLQWGLVVGEMAAPLAILWQRRLRS